MLRLIGSQFRRPSGLLGRLIAQIMLKGNKPSYDKLIPELDIRPNDRILEIGYGHGMGIKRIASGWDCYITGIDFSELMYKEATKRNKKYIDNKKVELFYGNFLSSEVILNQCDKVFCINVIYFWDDLAEAFSKLKTVLKEDGLFCMYMVHTDELKNLKFTSNDIFNKYSIDQVVDNLTKAGFIDIKYNFNKGYLIKCKKSA